MTDDVRCFAAVSLAPEVERAVVGALTDLRKGVRGGVKWVSPAQLHVTIKFYGEVAASGLPALAEALGGVAARARPALLDVEGAGTFPPHGAPRVVWLGLRNDDGHLAALQAAVEAASEPLGFARERRAFHPHLTLGRVREGERPAGLTEALAPLRSRPFGRSRVATMTLFRSDLRREGPLYTVLRSWSLEGGE